MFKRVFIAALICFSSALAAQEDGDDKKDLSGANVGTEFGVFIGNILPNQIDGVSEITGLGGARFGYGLGGLSFVEGAFTTGNGNGVEWKNVELSIRMDIPVENLVGIAYIGPDLTYYKPAGSDSNKIVFGAHAGGGVQTLVGRTTWFRFDMKFGVSPGTSLYIGVGFVFRFPGGGVGGGE
jgi:hypothetical protein